MYTMYVWSMCTMILNVTYRMAPANAIVPNCGPSAYLMLRVVVPCGEAANLKLLTLLCMNQRQRHVCPNLL